MERLWIDYAHSAFILHFVALTRRVREGRRMTCICLTLSSFKDKMCTEKRLCGQSASLIISIISTAVEEKSSKNKATFCLV